MSYNNPHYTNHFSKYGFELSDFQKYAIQAIVDGNHALVTAHTGSGKTLPAEFAMKREFSTVMELLAEIAPPFAPPAVQFTKEVE